MSFAAGIRFAYETEFALRKSEPAAQGR